MPKKKLFIEAASLTEQKMSGIGHMVLETVKALDELASKNNELEIFLVVSYDKAESLKRFNFKNVKVKKIFCPMRIFNIIWKFDLLPPMDLLLGKGTYIFPNYKNWRLYKSRNLTYISDVSYLVCPEFVSPKNQKFLEKNIHKWAKRSDKVITISENSKNEIKKLIQEAKEVQVIYCGVDSNMYHKKSRDSILKVKQKLGIEAGKKYLLYIGNIEPRKNINGILESYKNLPKKISDDVSLVLVGGGGWLNEPIKNAIEQMKKSGYSIINPSFYVPDEDLPALISGSEALIHPAFYEGFGISPLQAMACETPIIVADNSSLPEVAGAAGNYVDANNIEEISLVTQEVLKGGSEVNKKVIEGFNRSKQFSWNKAAKLIVDNIQ